MELRGGLLDRVGWMWIASWSQAIVYDKFCLEKKIPTQSVGIAVQFEQ